MPYLRNYYIQEKLIQPFYFTENNQLQTFKHFFSVAIVVAQIKAYLKIFQIKKKTV